MSAGLNVVALDQENHGLVAVMNGDRVPRPFDPGTDVSLLPPGGGVVVADANVWAVRNPLSQSQYCWASSEELSVFLSELRGRSYDARVISNRFANSLYVRAGLPQSDAVVALADHVHGRVADGGLSGPLWCGSCHHHGMFDGGRPVRVPSDRARDRSFGQRELVVEDFLVIQNQVGYETPFLDAAVEVVWAAVSRPQRDLLNLKKTLPEARNRNRVAALACCNHDPWTGEVRMFDGRPWSSRFIRRRVIGLNGHMTGTGPQAPGNPMRAVLRSLGRGRNPSVLNDLDRAVAAAIWALHTHGPLPAV